MVQQLDSSVFIEKFKEEALEHLQSLNEGLLKLEKGVAGSQDIAEIFRAAHTLKGSAKMVGLDDIGNIAHKMEDLLGAVKDDRIEFSPEIGDLLFVSLDTIQLLLENPEQGASLVDVDAVITQLEKVYAGSAKLKSEKARAKDDLAPVLKEEKLDPPKAEVFKDKIKTEESNVGRRKDDHEDTIRVSTGKLDRLINMVGELAVNQIRAIELNKETTKTVKQIKQASKHWSMFKEYIEIHEGHDMNIEKAKMLESLSQSIEGLLGTLTGVMRHRLDNVARFDNIVNQLEEEIFEVRMLPVATIFQSLPRAVRDLSRALNREIEVELKGEDTELDKKMLEELSDPLIHMVRNSVDHGIEDPQERQTAGKNRNGKIVIEAKQEGEHVEISVSDDGRGFNLEKIKAKAMELGLVSEAELALMSPEAVFSFLFHPGFSTKEEVTEISGRGVGMDVVKSNIEKLEGTVKLNSTLGSGTTVTLRVPLTMAITRCLLVKSGGEILGIPTTTVEETTRIDPRDLQTIEGRLAINFRGEVLPVLHLADILGLKKISIEEDRYPIAIMRSASARIGFIVEEHLGEQELVIKGFDELLNDTPNVAGAAILGSGEVVVILHVADIINAARGQSQTRSLGEVIIEESETDEGTAIPEILVVDDSMATRELERNILRSCGYAVDVAIDGIDAIERLGVKRYDLVIADVEMPRLDGFSLTSKIKQSDDYKDTPVIIITSLSSDEDKKRGIECGADAYISKSSFSQDNLIETVRMVLGLRGK